MPYLVRKKVDGSVTDQWELLDKPIIFGRGEQADVKIPDERLSRQHFAVALKGEAYVVQDLKSTNGTYVNNERVSERELKPNDKIRGGQTVLVFLDEKPKGLATIMGEVERDGKGLHTFLGELDDAHNKKK